MKTGVKLIALVAVLALAWLAHRVILLAFFALVLAVVLSFPVRWLSRLMPRGAAVMVLVAVILGAITGAVLLGAPALSKQVEDAKAQLEQYRREWARFGALPATTDRLDRLNQLAVAPDGCTSDAEHALWIADALGGRVLRVDHAGAIVDEIVFETGRRVCTRRQ